MHPPLSLAVATKETNGYTSLGRRCALNPHHVTCCDIFPSDFSEINVQSILFQLTTVKDLLYMRRLWVYPLKMFFQTNGVWSWENRCDVASHAI